MRGKPGQKYSKEFKESIVKKMMPPQNERVSRIAEETGITEITLYKWKREAKAKGYATPGNGKNSENWSAEDKFLIVMETYTMNETELSTYCRSKGLYKEQVESWRESCKNANDSNKETNQHLNVELREEKKRVKSLEKELQKKEKALAEAAALLLLRKKAQAIWGDPEDE